MSETILEVRHLVKTYSQGFFTGKKVEAVKNVSFEVQKGDVYGFLGPNGAGKTTTVRCILGLSHPTGGDIFRFGNGEFDPAEFFGKTAYCPEESHFPPYVTGRELLSHWAGLYGLTKGALNTKVNEALEKVGLADSADRRLLTYSKGMKQRAGIAGVLLSDPEFIVLDEPARGLDPLARNLIRNLLVDLASEGKTIFMNSHILSEVERICTRAAIINKGQIRRQFHMKDLEKGRHLEVRYLPGPGNLPMPEGAKNGEGGGFVLQLPDTAALAEFARAVADAGGEILFAAKTRMDLEEYFIKVVGEEDEA